MIKKYELYLKNNKNFYLNFQINNVNRVINFCNNKLNLNKESQEVLYLIGANNQNYVTSVFEISRGSINFSLCSPIEIFKRLILSNCNNFILVHNHLSTCEPSKQDIEIFKQLKKACKLFDINFNDNLIICNNKYYSFYENEIMEEI